MKLSILFVLFGLKVVNAIIGDNCTVSSKIQECSLGEICDGSKCIEPRPCDTRHIYCPGSVFTRCYSGYCQYQRCTIDSHCIVGLVCKYPICGHIVNVSATEGSDVKLVCATSSDVTVDHWYRGSLSAPRCRLGYQGYTRSEDVTCSRVSPRELLDRETILTEEGDIIIENSTTRDSDVYTCQYNHPHRGSQHRIIGLYVYDSLEVSIGGIPSEPVVEATEVSMNCTARFTAYQTLEFYWIIDGRNVSGDVSGWQREDNGDILVYSIYTYAVNREDQGKLIKCHVIPTYGNETFAEHNIGEIMYSPRGTPSIQTSTEDDPNGEKVILTCTPPSDSGNPPCVTWIRVDGNENYTSTVPQFRLDERYTCVCTNQIGSSNASDVVEFSSLREKSGSAVVIGLSVGLVICILVVVVFIITAVVVCKRYRKFIPTKGAKEETATSGTSDEAGPKGHKNEAVYFQQNNKKQTNNTYKKPSDDDNNNEEYLQPKRQAVSVVSDYQELNEAVIEKGLDEEFVPCPANRQSDVSYENVM